MAVSKLASKRIPVTVEVWEEMSRLKEPGQTYSSLLEEMIEETKMRRLADELKRIETEGRFVPFDE